MSVFSLLHLRLFENMQLMYGLHICLYHSHSNTQRVCPREAVQSEYMKNTL